MLKVSPNTDPSTSAHMDVDTRGHTWIDVDRSANSHSKQKAQALSRRAERRDVVCVNTLWDYFCAESGNDAM